jgi:hypothetical protein
VHGIREHDDAKGQALIQLEQVAIENPTEIAQALGLKSIRAARRRRRKDGPCCEECFFHRHLLCALDLDQPCSTFRPDSEQGLVPPTQPALLIRDT